MDRPDSDQPATSEEGTALGLKGLTQNILAKIYSPERPPSFTHLGLAANHDECDALAGAILTESMACDVAEAAFPETLTVDAGQASIEPIEIVEETMRGAVAVMEQTKVETRSYRGALYEKGADGQWHRQQSQPSDPAEAPPSDILSADAGQASIEPIEIVEETLQSANAPIAQTEAETRSYRGALYEKGADGQWHLQQSQPSDPAEAPPSDILSADVEQTPFEPIEFVEETLQSASAPIEQTEVETLCSYRGFLYDRDADGEGFLQQAQASFPTRSLGQHIWETIFTSKQAPSFTQMGLAANQNDGSTLADATQPESMASDSVEALSAGILTMDATQAPSITQTGPAANNDECSTLPDAIQPEIVSLASDSADPASAGILTADTTQAPSEPIDIVEETSQSASAPIEQTEVKTRSYRGALYEKGADGQWHLRQSEASDSAEAHPSGVLSADAAQATIEPVESVKGVLQTASAPIMQIEAEMPSSYSGPLNERGADSGEAYPQQSQASFPARSLGRRVWQRIFTSKQTPSITQMGLAANHDNGDSLPDAIQQIHPESVASNPADLSSPGIRVADAAHALNLTPVGLAANHDECGALPVEIQPETMVCDSAEAASPGVLSTDAPQAPLELMQSAERFLQSANAPVAQAEAETRTYKVLTYLQGADGQWILQHSQTTVVNMQTPNAPLMTLVPIAQDTASFHAELQTPSAKADSTRPRKTEPRSKTAIKKKSMAKAAAMPPMITKTKPSVSQSLFSNI
jgi:hypothetical protein